MRPLFHGCLPTLRQHYSQSLRGLIYTNRQSFSTTSSLCGSFTFLDPPSVRNILDFYHINRNDVPLTPSGKNGRFTKQDIQQFMKTESFAKLKSKKQSQTQSQAQSQTQSPTQSQSQSPTQSQTQSQSQSPTQSHSQSQSPSQTRTQTPAFIDQPTSQIRKVIANRLLESKQNIPHLYMTVEACIDPIMNLREQYKKRGIKVSVNDFLILMVARALDRVPQCNVIFDSKRQTHVMVDRVDVSVAVATPTGLITPIVFNANRLSVEQISAKVKDLATRARDNKLKPEEYQGGSFAISNLGMFGISSFEAVINPPHGAILAVGGIERRVQFEQQENISYDLDDLDPDAPTQGNLSTQQMISLTASCDQRAIDDADLSKFMSTLKDLIECRVL